MLLCKVDGVDPDVLSVVEAMVTGLRGWIQEARQ
jgi:hypothetical protein